MFAAAQALWTHLDTVNRTNTHDSEMVDIEELIEVTAPSQPDGRFFGEPYPGWTPELEEEGRFMQDMVVWSR